MALDNLKQFIDKLSAFDFAAEQELIVENHTDTIAEMQVEQLYQGVDSLGNPIRLPNPGGGYAASTIKRKIKKGQITSRVVWRDTGNFYKSLQGVVDNGQFTITSLEGQYPMAALLDRSGEEVIGLDENYRTKFANEVLMPDFRAVLQNKTGLTIS